jgi:hypothetical protein
MIVIADTSPLNYLILLRKAEVLSAIYGRVLAPKAVLLELLHPEAPEMVRAWSATPPIYRPKSLMCCGLALLRELCRQRMEPPHIQS